MGNTESNTSDTPKSVPVPQVSSSEGPQRGKSGKKICCACPETRKLRDACIVGKGETECNAEIEAHKACLREDGFRV